MFCLTKIAAATHTVLIKIKQRFNGSTAFKKQVIFASESEIGILGGPRSSTALTGWITK